MRAMRVSKFGGSDALQCDEIPVPEPGPGQARIKIEFAGVNYSDVQRCAGQFGGELPMTLGGEGAGQVDAVAPDVTVVRPGDRVTYAMQPGSYADYAIVQAWKLVPIPADIETRAAAAVINQGLTAHYLSQSAYPVRDGDTILVHAAAGGVGLLLTQMAKMRGARVIGTVSTEEKAAVARAAGAEVIVHTQQDFEAEVKRLTDGKGVNVVYDSVGKATFDKGLNCLKPRGFMVLYGQASGDVAPVDPLTLNAKGALYLTRTSMAYYMPDRAELLNRANDLFEWMRTGKLQVRIDQVIPLTKASRALEYMANRQSKGKVLLVA
jgi:NADPH2:quinone reductase